MKIKSHKLTAICMVRRDELRQNASQMLTNAEKAYEKAEEQARALLQTAKTALHTAKINSNRMNKEADLIQEAINEELEMQIKEQQEVEKAWEVKSAGHLKAELEADDCLVELIKKVN